jgi:hypothetical protein
LLPFRKELYGLFPGNWDASIADLGDILQVIPLKTAILL